MKNPIVIFFIVIFVWLFLIKDKLGIVENIVKNLSVPVLTSEEIVESELDKTLDKESENRIKKIINSVDEIKEQKKKLVKTTDKLNTQDDLIVSCRWYEWIESTKEGLVTEYLRRDDVMNPEKNDGYIHYNFRENSLMSNFSRLNKYSKIYVSSKREDIILVKDQSLKGDEIIFTVTYGPNIYEPFNDKREQNQFRLNKYTLEMTVRYYLIDRSTGSRFEKYKCEKIDKLNY